MPTISYTIKSNDALADPTSVILTNVAATVGVKRNDTGEVVVAAGTVFTQTGTGKYSYTFTAPATNVFYTAYIQIVASGSTLYQELGFYVGIDATTIMVPSAILADYCIGTLGVFTAVGGTTWPLYHSCLPDGPNVLDNIVAIYDTSGYLQGKNMRRVLDQRYGIQFMLRSIDYDTGYQKLASVLETFEAVHNADVVLGSQTFQIGNISQASAIGVLGIEPTTKQRYLFSANLLITLKEI